MKTIVLDTNILVSALIYPERTPGLILHMATDDDCIICYDMRILDEYQEVLNRPRFDFPPSQVEELISEIIENGISITAAPAGVGFTDQSDKPFYEVAKSSGSTLVTGNTKHYPDEPFIMTPAQFLETYYG